MAVKLLLERGANPRERAGSRPLVFHAAVNHLTVIVSMLIAAGAAVDDADLRGGKLTALQAVCQAGDVSMARLLLLAGADARALGGTGVSALGYAQEAGNAALVAMLEGR